MASQLGQWVGDSCPWMREIAHTTPTHMDMLKTPMMLHKVLFVVDLK